MTQQEIKEEIDTRYATIESLMKPNQFTLNPIIQNLLIEIGQL